MRWKLYQLVSWSPPRWAFIAATVWLVFGVVMMLAGQVETER